MIDPGRRAEFDEQPAFQIRRHDPVVQTDRADSPLQFVVRVFAVPVPDPHPPLRLHADQVPPGRHRHRFDQLQRRLADRSRRDRRRSELADVMPPVNKVPARNELRITQNKRRGRDQRRLRFLSRFLFLFSRLSLVLAPTAPARLHRLLDHCEFNRGITCANRLRRVPVCVLDLVHQRRPFALLAFQLPRWRSFLLVPLPGHQLQAHLLGDPHGANITRDIQRHQIAARPFDCLRCRVDQPVLRPLNRAFGIDLADRLVEVNNFLAALVARPQRQFHQPRGQQRGHSRFNQLIIHPVHRRADADDIAAVRLDIDVLGHARLRVGNVPVGQIIVVIAVRRFHHHGRAPSRLDMRRPRHMADLVAFRIVIEHDQPQHRIGRSQRPSARHPDVIIQPRPPHSDLRRVRGRQFRPSRNRRKFAANAQWEYAKPLRRQCQRT